MTTAIKRTVQEIKDIAVDLFHHRDNGRPVDGSPSLAHMSPDDELKVLDLYDKLKEAEDRILREYK